MDRRIFYIAYKDNRFVHFLFMINRMLAVPMLILVVLMLVFSYGQNKKMQETFMDNRRKSVILIRVFRILWRA